MLRRPSGLGWKLPLFLFCGAVLALWVGLKLPCPIRCLTGVICPSCGMSRAWVAALRLDLGGAFRYHPMFWSVPLFGLLVLYDCRLFRHRALNNGLLAALLLAFLLCYCFRLIAFLNGHLPI